jgi:polysaccharide export outer membrane protein
MKKTIILSFIIIFMFVASFARSQDYIVGPGDVLDISVYDNPDMTTTVRVSGDGVIILPLLNQIDVAGLTISQVSDKVATLLADGYIVNPQVNVFVTEYRSKKAVILGQVVSPGLYELRGHTTLLELVSEAGGLSRDAGDHAIIKRHISGGDGNKTEDVITIDLRKLIEQGDMSQNIQIVDGDSLFISKAGVFYVNGKVNRPGSYKHEENITLIKAISIAGGFADEAAKKSVSIIRKINGRKSVLEKVSLDEQILPDDVIDTFARVSQNYQKKTIYSFYFLFNNHYRCFRRYVYQHPNL